MLERDDSPMNAAELLIEILRKGDALGIFFLMQETDVESLMQLRYNMIASDGTLIRYGEGMPHSRSYGTFPRIIARYVKEKKLLSLEEAIRKMTSLPAHTLKYFARGLIRKRYWADLVIFDLASIEDTSKFTDPHHYPRGIHYVLVNGKIAARDGKPTGTLAGRVLLGPGSRAVYTEKYFGYETSFGDHSSSAFIEKEK